MNKILAMFWHSIVRILKALLKIFHITLSQSQLEALLQFIKFGFVGLSNTLLFYVVYLVVLKVLQSLSLFTEIDYIIGNILGWLLSVLWSFYWNRKYVFEATDNETVPWQQALLKTYLSYAFTGLVLNNVLSYVWIEWIGMGKVYAPIINLLITVPLNFVLNKFWTFKKKK